MVGKPAVDSEVHRPLSKITSLHFDAFQNKRHFLPGRSASTSRADDTLRVDHTLPWYSVAVVARVWLIRCGGQMFQTNADLSWSFGYGVFSLTLCF